jgi:acyl-CoA-binding protein
MESLYSERHGMRQEVKKTYDISIDAYNLIIDCCRKYFPNLGYKYPEYCYDGDYICGTDEKKLFSYLKFRIPNLFNYDIDNSLLTVTEFDNYDQYALLDFIEYLVQNMKTIKSRTFHDYFKHNHYKYDDTPNDFLKFREEINDLFKTTGLLYVLTKEKIIERITESDLQIDKAIDDIKNIHEQGLKDLIQESVRLYKSPKQEDNNLATEKIWDALERIKTELKGKDKKDSANKLVALISHSNPEYQVLFQSEFSELTKIGNQFRIRHHEIDKIEIDDNRYYDYLFNRCFALLSLAVKFINE